MGRRRRPTYRGSTADRLFASYRVERSTGAGYAPCGVTTAEAFYDCAVRPGTVYQCRVIGVRADATEAQVATFLVHVPSFRPQDRIPPMAPVDRALLRRPGVARLEHARNAGGRGVTPPDRIATA